MGMITDFISLLFGSNRNVLAETAEVFRENAEKAGARSAQAQSEALQQFAAEFQHARRGWFDRFVDGLNRLPRPIMAFGTLGLVAAAMWEPVWFASRMEGLALVPEPLWWLMGAIVSFYFGARHQAKGQEFQDSIARTLVRRPVSPVLTPDTLTVPRIANVTTAPIETNAALREWQASNGI